MHVTAKLTSRSGSLPGSSNLLLPALYHVYALGLAAGCRCRHLFTFIFHTSIILEESNTRSNILLLLITYWFIRRPESLRSSLGRVTARQTLNPCACRSTSFSPKIVVARCFPTAGLRLLWTVIRKRRYPVEASLAGS